MKILIISHYYKHKNAMASIRPIKLAKYFSRYGHDVTVLTSLQKDNWCKQDLTPTYSDEIREIYAEPHSGMKYLAKVYDKVKQRGQRKASAKSESQSGETPSGQNSKGGMKSKIKGYLSWAYYYTADRLENYFLAQGLIDAAVKENLSGYDIVIATYPGAGVHAAGEWFKKKKRAKRFVADYRDPAYNPGGRSNKIELRHDKHVQDMALKYADAVVCVSQGMADSLKVQYGASKIPPVHVVKNGFDPDDNVSAVKSDLNPGKFNFVYTGALYQGRRTVDMLAKVLRQLITEGKLTADEVAINYAGPDFAELIHQLREYSLEAIAVDFGYVSREQSLGMQQDADIVLLLNWNDDNYTGVIPGKLYEYMSSHRPILALIMGNRAGSESAKMIEDCDLGCACEEAAHADIDKLKAFISQKLTDFRNGMREGLATEKISPFEYRNIAKEYLAVLERMK
ncbi:MAG: glycosyltransferase [Muribaculaceae bacterium]|nr:glycosyltransferase [Muribaculaceae bacterium]